MRSGDFKTVILAIVAAVFGVSIVFCQSYVLDRFKAWVACLVYLCSGLFGVGIGNGFLKGVGASESALVFGGFRRNGCNCCTFYSISACCAAGLLVIQLSLNVFGATDILPLTGVTFPFISCGGSSVLSCWGLIAFIKAADERTYAVKK